MSDFFYLIKEAGAVAAALAAIGALVYSVVHFTSKRFEARVTELICQATEPLRKNGGGNVGDLPSRFDEMERRVQRIERRQLKIYEEIVDGSDES